MRKMCLTLDSDMMSDDPWIIRQDPLTQPPLLPIGSKAPSHLILSDSSSVSSCLLRTHWEWSGTVKDESMECFRRDRWKPKCQTPDWRGELTERWWTMREALCLAKKRRLYTVYRRTLSCHVLQVFRQINKWFSPYGFKTVGIQVNRGDLAVSACKCLALEAAQLSGDD